jgi:ribosomal protein S18 acetylase RimI-like enzyme
MTKPAQIKIGELSVAHLPEIVAVHVQSFPRSATTRLGPEAVRRYYEWQFIGPHDAHYLGAWVDDQLGGFCFCGKFRGAMEGFLARNTWFLARQVLMRPWLLTSPEVRSAVVAVVRRLLPRSRKACPAGPQPQEARRFGILATAVAPRCRRLGLGARMMEEAEKLAHKVGFEAMGLTVNPANEPAICFYKRLGWTPISDSGHWQGRMEKLLSQD